MNKGGVLLHYYVKAGTYLLKNGEKTTGYLSIEDGKFGDFVDEVPQGAEVLDYSDYMIAPGLFDTHIHGVSGHDVMDGSANAIEQISQSIVADGVTRFLPTTLTSADKDVEEAIKAVVEAVEAGLPGAKSEGIYLEGPYFTEKHKGAQNPGYFKDPNFEEFQSWQELAKGQIIKIALAPERNGSKEFIELLKEAGVYTSIAHTDATYECANDAVKAGANNFTHLFNGMSGLHHREPGVVGSAFMNKAAYAEIICDGYHTHPDIARLALQMKENQLVLITDCMRAGKMADGEYLLGEFKVTLTNGIARTDAGSLAGSTLKLIDGIKNLQQWSSDPLYKIWHLASLSPAKSIGKDAKLGSIAKGKYADFVVFDQDFNVQVTAVEGLIR